MTKILEILRLRFEQGLSGRAIALAVCSALSTVQACLRRFAEAQLPWPTDLDEAGLAARLYRPDGRKVATQIVDYAWAVERLRSFKGITRERVWRELREAGQCGISYSAFCAGLKRFLQLQKLSARQLHAPGAVMFVDYAGPPLWVTDRSTGERRAVRVFVAALGFSSAMFAWATPTESAEHWLLGQSLALEFFGGVPERVVPDNPKALVHQACRYEPELNRSYVEWAEHYGCAVVPARVRKPQDKSLVELAVQVLERWAYPDLLKQTFFDLPSLNAALRDCVAAANAKPFQKREGSRAQALVSEQAVLRALPGARYSYGRWTRAKVPLDYHVAVDQRCYSVPYQLVGKTLDIRASATLIEIYHHGKRVASHRRVEARGDASTVPEHRPVHHQPVTMEPMLARAQAIGPATAAVVQAQLDQKKHPQQVQRSMMGIIRLAQDHGEAALEAACARAQALGNSSYRTLLGLIKVAPPEPARQAPQLQHEHLRGAAYFGGESCTIH